MLAAKDSSKGRSKTFGFKFNFNSVCESIGHRSLSTHFCDEHCTVKLWQPLVSYLLSRLLKMVWLWLRHPPFCGQTVNIQLNKCQSNCSARKWPFTGRIWQAALFKASGEFQIWGTTDHVQPDPAFHLLPRLAPHC